MQVMFEGENRPAPVDGCSAVWLQLRIRRLGRLPAFTAAIPSVIRHAKSFPGMVRFGFDIDWETATFRTFGAFDSEASLRAYVGDGAHGAIYRRLGGRLGEMRSSYGTIPAQALPTTWDDILEACFVHKGEVTQQHGSPTDPVGCPAAPMSP